MSESLEAAHNRVVNYLMEEGYAVRTTVPGELIVYLEPGSPPLDFHDEEIHPYGADRMTTLMNPDSDFSAKADISVDWDEVNNNE